ncbi:mucin-3A [Spodoptera litura]|uniref:Cuticular protein SlCPAP1-J n=1 Tax=Spodoptera litura TaxID=69820 RepID=A0A4U7BGC7_SPOLT|nr:mucin-3A [Spodoptera litura]XP_022815651.1 mucin-3A [Spodoptera litura]XP_022815652.1 mucin-3A [Spodoptera litura]TKX27754.1 cuticular protein SlCPAP1-J [Spodoptera litura]
MRWRESKVGADTMKTILIFTLIMICSCDGARRTAQRRQDTELYAPSPSVESLQELAQAMGAAGFEHYTEGKALVKRLIPPDNQPEDIVEYQGVIGRAGIDFPAFPNIPPTGFNCKNVPTGYYADLETDCQVFHICDTSRKISFLCPNGTIFSQSHLICDWWFKVDCASAPALYESSAEYYSNEQKKSQKITQSLSKNQDLQQIGADTNIRAESRRTPVNVPSTTERLLRSRQRQTEIPKATVKTYQALFTDNFNPTQRTAATTAFEQRRKSLVQLISTNFGNIPARTTQPTYTESPVYRSSTPDYSLREMQVAAETAAFANNNNRQYLQDFHNKNYRPYPVYTPNIPTKPKAKSNPNLTTLYDFRDKQSAPSTAEPTTTKRPTLIPYTKSYSTIIEKQEPYTRPGVSLLKGFLQKEKNKTLSLTTTTEKVQQVTARSDNLETEKQGTDNTKDNFESATKIPHTTRADVYTQTASSDRYDVYSTTNHATQTTTEPSYQERRERLMRKLNLDRYAPTATEPTVPTTNTDKYFGDQPNRPGLVVPPSLTPKTLHSLAIYYATALDNLSTTPTPEEAETVTPAFDEYEAMEEVLPALFSRQTINKYSNLFGHQMTNAELLEEIREDPNGTYNELVEDLSVQQSQNPIATSPQIRELAQVFTHALSAYLQDPVQFRKVLSDIRPTHPSFGDLLTTTEEYINTEPTTTVNEEDDEILGFSDDHKAVPPVSNLREPKALGIPTIYPVTEETTTTPRPATEYTTPSYSSYSSLSTVRNPFRCCGRISASYTSPSTPAATTPSYTNTVAVTVNTLSSHDNEPSSTTEADYSVHKYGGFQNNALTLNDSPYGTNAVSTEGKPLSEYVEATNLPTAWGIDPSASTTNDFESKKIKTTTELPPTTSVYFTETESVELENEEELQRAHSQSFAAPQGNSIRHGKQINFDAEPIKKPAEDLEAPTIPDDDLTTVQTTTQPTTTVRVTEIESLTTTPTASEVVFTSPDSDKSTNQQSWSSTAYGNWQSTVIDPITLNDGLSATALDQNQGLSENTYIPNTATTPTEYIATEQTAAPTVSFEVSTHETKEFERQGRLLRDSSTEPAQDLTTITDTVVEKAKEIMNATTAEKLMNVMKKTKSKTVKRLILLLIQTCDDDHNTTAEASKKALLEALMAVSQKDMEDIAKEEETTEVPTTEANVLRRVDRVEKTRGDRRGKSLNFDPSAVNSLSNVAQTSTTTETAKTTEDLETAATTFSPLRTNTASRRGIKKFHVRTTPVEPRTTATAPFVDSPIAEARVSGPSDTKATSDTRALELLRSLYSIAARWG